MATLATCNRDNCSGTSSFINKNSIARHDLPITEVYGLEVVSSGKLETD